jgi:pimeloyl-ACP methyl ester carboxylesterase
VALVLLVTLTAGCASPIGARRISAREADRQLAANVLATGEPSAWSLQTLHRSALLDLYRKNRAKALGRLHASLAEPDLGDERLRGRLFALSELAFDHARRQEKGLFRSGRREEARPWFLASAVYAFGFLTSRPEYTEADALDSRTRLAADLYNRALTEGLRQDGTLHIADGEHALPFGTVSLDLDEATLRWGSFLLTDFVPTAEFETRGIANRYRHAGVGAPVAAGVALAPGASGADARHIGPRVRVPSTLLMFLDFSREALVGGELRGTLELHTANIGRELVINDRPVPLEVDSTAALALQLDRFDALVASRRAFFSGDLSAIDPDRLADQLGMLTPYRRGRIPVVFVHGTNSEPSTWAEMVNELQNDPALSDKLQFWFFFYSSGSPIGYSGGLLAEGLRRIVRELDPESSDPALQQMVVIGHSQGGLLTKLTAVDSGSRFWDGFFDRPPEELAVSEETREILVRSLIFEPVESVSRVVFVSTPHGGSFLTRNPLAGLVGGLISIPGGLQDRVADLLQTDPDAVALESLDELPTSLDNMRPGNPFLEALRELPIVDAVGVHSIVAVSGDGPREQLSDGVVRYMSAHISQGTERLVQSGHSAQRNPVAITEVRRILREHLALAGQRERPDAAPGAADR